MRTPGNLNGSLASISSDYKIPLDSALRVCYARSTMEARPLRVGDLVRMNAKNDRFHGTKGIIVDRVESSTYTQGFHYEVQTLDGYVIVALDFELELLENEVKIPN